MNYTKTKTLEDISDLLHSNSSAIKRTRAVTYIFDVVIIMIAILYAFDLNFSKWLLLPAAASVCLHTHLSNLYEEKCRLKQQEVVLKMEVKN